MKRTVRALALSAAASALSLGPGFAQDFIETIAAQAPLEDPAQAEKCEKEASAQLAEPLAELRKRCADASGQFNVGNVTPSIHRKSCSVYQTATCSATDAPAAPKEASTAPKEASAADDASAPPAHPEPLLKPAEKSGKPGKPAKKRAPRKPRAAVRTAGAGETTPPAGQAGSR